nr:mRNA decapping enzyme subunit 2 [Hymenolepis microstoma]
MEAGNKPISEWMLKIVLRHRRSTLFATAVILDADWRQCLLVRGFYSSQWQFPDGKMEPNEFYAKCLIRELKEEHSFDISSYISESLSVNTLGTSRDSFLLMNRMKSTIQKKTKKDGESPDDTNTSEELHIISITCTASVEGLDEEEQRSQLKINVEAESSKQHTDSSAALRARNRTHCGGCIPKDTSQQVFIGENNDVISCDENNLASVHTNPPVESPPATTDQRISSNSTAQTPDKSLSDDYCSTLQVAQVCVGMGGVNGVEFSRRITTAADPSVEFWRDFTRQELLDTYNIDTFTIMESNLTDDKLTYYQFPGYTLHMLPRDGQVASGILIGVKEGLTSHCKIIKSMVYAVYNPPQNRSNFDLLYISHKTVLVGDFNTHSTRWGYKNRNTAGKKIKDILNSSPLEPIYSDEDPATYLHYNETRTTPDLLLVSSHISELTQRKIIDDPGSVHKPVIASITINSKSMTPKMPIKFLRKLKKTDWHKFTSLLETEINESPINYNQHPDKLCKNITNIMIKCAKKTILRGKLKHYRVFWTKTLKNRKENGKSFATLLNRLE